MYDPISVETALVSSGGDLLIQLSDGNVVNAGRVRGNPGPQGEKGESGIRGAHGKDGTDGTNGAQWHTGVGAPELAVGENNDMYMDVASSVLPIFQKVNGDWLFLANLKTPAGGVGGGGGGGAAAGDGGAIIIYPMPDGGTPPSTDNEGKPIDKGDIWIDTNTGLLWIYNGTNWLPVGDRPPVIISPTPPAYNNASDTNIQYPVVEGDLWFDSDQLALYVAAKDTGDNLVWVITIPADRSTLIPLVPISTFVFPASATGTYVDDGTIALNTVTEISYVYNAPKNQWIDLPKPEAADLIGDCLNEDETVCDRLEDIDNELSNIEQIQRDLHAIVSASVYFYPGFGLVGQLPNPGEYLPYEYTSILDGGGIEKPTYFKSPAEEYESITHMRISAVAGPNGHLERAEAGDTMYIQHVGNDSGGKYTITQIDVEGAGPTGYFEIYVEFVEGFSDGNIEHPGYDQIQVVSKDLLSAARKEAFTRFYEAVDPATYSSGDDGTCVLVGAATINTITNVKLSSNDNQGKVRYIYKVNEDILIEDERNGAYAVLRVTAVNVAGDYDVELEHYNGVGNIDFGQIYAFGSAADRGAIPDVGEDTQQPGTLDDRYVNEKGGDTMEGPLQITGGRDPNADGIEGTIKVLNVDSGQNSSLNLKHNGATQIYVGSTQTSFQGDIKFNAGGRAIYAGNDKKAFVINDGGVFYDGAYTVDRHVATKKNLDDVKDSLYQDIIELEQEIDAIAPSLEYGTWKFGIPANSGRPPSTGTFYLLDGIEYTDEYEKVTGIAIHNDEYVAPGDTDPVDNHTWADADVGELVQLFDSADPDFFLGKITAKNVDTIGQCVYLTVDRIQSSGVPNDNPDPVTGEFLTRVNIFKEPSGGTASEFVLKSGDTMSGDLAIDVSEKSNDIEAGLILKGSRSTHTNSAATIKFDNEQSTQKGYLTYRAMGTDSWFAFNRSLDLNNNGLHSVGQIRMQPGLNYIGAGNASRIKINNGSNTEAGTEIQRPGDGKRTFAIKGKSAGSGDVTDFFWVYGNGGTGGDAVNYTGKMTSNDNIVNKGYVDSKVGGIDIDCNASGRSTGEMWYCPNDQVLYIKVS